MNNNFKIIDPSAKNLPENAVILKVTSEDNRLSQEEHRKAVKAVLLFDSTILGIDKDFAFVQKIPQLIKEIIENKAWECFYVSTGVVIPYYCCYNKGSDSDNFRAFISAKRPNGFETTVETIDRLLGSDPEVQWMFRTIIYEASEKQRDELGKYTSLPEGSDCPLDLSERQQKNIRAANRAGEAIPEVRELLDRGLIAIDVAAKLGRKIKDPNNLTAEEREYIDKRDLIGFRIKQYINTNTIPEDEDQESAYRRKLNLYVKDLLGIKNRSKPIRVDNTKIGAKQLSEYYKREKLEFKIKQFSENLQIEALIDNPKIEAKQLFEYSKGKESELKQYIEDLLTEGLIAYEFYKEEELKHLTQLIETLPKRLELQVNQANSKPNQIEEEVKTNESTQQEEIVEDESLSDEFDSQEETSEINPKEKENDCFNENEKSFIIQNQSSTEELPEDIVLSNQTESQISSPDDENDQIETDTNIIELTREQLARRLNVVTGTLQNATTAKRIASFAEWTKNKDPEGIAWQRIRKKDNTWYFTPLENNQKSVSRG